MRIALVHDHLIQDGGAERVLKVFHEMYPSAPIFTLVYDKKKLGKTFEPEAIRTSFLQNIPGSTRAYQWLLPLMPAATEGYDLSEYDVVLSSSSAFSKGVITKSTTLHVSYCHTPTRYLWTDTHSYIREVRAPRLMKMGIPLMLNRLRQWDCLAADRVDKFVANSRTVQERIKKYYRRDSDIIYPPVEVDQFSLESYGDYYLAGGRLVSYKRFDLVVDAFNRLGIKLKIFGDGPFYKTLSKNAKKNIEFLGAVSDKERATLYQRCIAYIHPQEEDFGITVIEAAAAGRPVIAFAAGGALETVIDGVTGLFFYDQDYAALIDIILRFNPELFNPDVIRKSSLRYGTDRFKRDISQFIDTSWREWQEWQEMKRLRDTKMLFM